MNTLAQLSGLQRRIARFATDRSGVSAVEFAMLLPLMITLYLGTVEISQGVAIDRKVTLTSRTIADLTSQVSTIATSDMTNVFDAASSVIAPYNTDMSLLTMTVSLEAIILSTLLLFSSNRQGARDRIRSDIEYEINLKAELEVAHLHEKTDRIYEDMLERFAKIEKALGIAPRVSGQMKAAASDPALPKAEAKTT